MISQDSSQMAKAHSSLTFLPHPEISPGTCGCLFLLDKILHSDKLSIKLEMWLYLIYKHCPIENGSGKTVDSSGKTVLIHVPLTSSVISVDNSVNTTKYYYWYTTGNKWLRH